MPNWCSNTIVIEGDLQDLVDLKYAMEDRGFCEAVVPIGEWNYDAALKEWGCKWDMSDPYYDLTDDGNGSGTLIIDGNTPWGPPIEVLKELAKQYSDIEAWWVEPGMNMAGQMIGEEVTDFDVSRLSEATEEQQEAMCDGLREWLADEDIMDQAWSDLEEASDD